VASPARRSWLVVGLLAAGTAWAEQTRIVTRPGPFKGYTQTEITRSGDAHVTRCTTRPGPFKSETVTTCT